MSFAVSCLRLLCWAPLHATKTRSSQGTLRRIPRAYRVARRGARGDLTAQARLAKMLGSGAVTESVTAPVDRLAGADAGCACTEPPREDPRLRLRASAQAHSVQARSARSVQTVPASSEDCRRRPSRI